MRTNRRFLTLSILAFLAGTVSQSTTPQHERLRLRNTFKTPEEVVSYYCARDASGFIWSGLLDAERRAFTLWNDAPQQDSFYVARKYEVTRSHPVAHKKDQATVDVRYEVTAIADAHGSRMPPPRQDLVVSFNLKRVDGVWKISKPDAAEIAPVVLESKFPSIR